MRPFKVRAITLLITLFAFSATFYSACQKDPCKDVSCLNGGTCEDGLCKCPTGWVGANCETSKCEGITCTNGGSCVDGKCQCPLGYEGDHCETETRNKFQGVWVVTEDGSFSNAAQYMVSVTAGTTIAEVKIQNFRNAFTEKISATVNGDSIIIPEQVVSNDTISGKGVISDDQFYGKNGKVLFRYKIRYSDGTVDDFGVNAGEMSYWNK